MVLPPAESKDVEKRHNKPVSTTKAVDIDVDHDVDTEIDSAIANKIKLQGKTVHGVSYEVAFTAINVLTYIIPVALTTHMVMTQGWPVWYHWPFIPLMTTYYIGVPMSCCLHRYFSHSAYETSRGFQVLLALLATLAYQKGPLWWASKHNRHHKHCDTNKDPHSVVQDGFMYAWVGWTLVSREEHIDWEFVKRFQNFPELKLINDYYIIPTTLFQAAVCYYSSYSFMICFSTLPMILCRLITLLFNVEYHPAHHQTEKVCKAKDDDRVLALIVGESQHFDHHRYPRKALRPDWDVPRYVFLLPLEKMGLIWNLNRVGVKE